MCSRTENKIWFLSLRSTKTSSSYNRLAAQIYMTGTRGNSRQHGRSLLGRQRMVGHCDEISPSNSKHLANT